MKRISLIIIMLIISASVFGTKEETAEYGKCIDVSEFQGEIDWNEVREAGVEYAIIRCGTTNFNDTEYIKDSRFYENYYGAKKAGIKTGAYMFTVAASEYEMERNTEEMLGTIKGLEFDLPIFIDAESEGIQSRLSKKQLTKIVLRGCEKIEGAGYTAGVYANRKWMKYEISSSEIKGKGYALWGAIYPDMSEPVNPKEYNHSAYDIWQYSNAGQVKGITEKVDLDYIYRLKQ